MSSQRSCLAMDDIALIQPQTLTTGTKMLWTVLLLPSAIRECFVALAQPLGERWAKETAQGFLMALRMYGELRQILP